MKAALITAPAGGQLSSEHRSRGGIGKPIHLLELTIRCLIKADYSASYDILEKQHGWWIARRKILFGLMGQYPPGRISPPPALLEIGCGCGITLSYLDRDYQCTGIDPNPDFIRKARTNSRAVFLEGKLPEPLPPLNGVFDRILLLDVLEHIEDDRQALQIIRQLLTPEGILILNVPALPLLWSIHDEANEHVRRYGKTEILKVLSESGFRILSFRPWGASLIPFAFLRKILHRGESAAHYKVSPPPEWLNQKLAQLLSFETRLHLPFGLSFMIAAAPGPTARS